MILRVIHTISPIQFLFKDRYYEVLQAIVSFEFLYELEKIKSTLTLVAAKLDNQQDLYVYYSGSKASEQCSR